MSLRPDNFSIITNGTAGTASFTSSSFWMWGTHRLSGQAVVSSGSLVGTFTLQVSNDKAMGAFQGQFQPTNWNTIGSTTQLLNCSSSATVKSFMFPYTEVCYQYGRVVYTDQSSGAAVGLFNFNMNTMAS